MSLLKFKTVLKFEILSLFTAGQINTNILQLEKKKKKNLKPLTLSNFPADVTI